MSKKISELEEITNLDSPTYTIVDQGEGVNAKYDLQNLNNKINKTNNILGEIEEFNTTSYYYPGQFIRHQGKIWKFTEKHYPGPWNEDEIQEFTVFDELKEIGSSDYENLTITLTSDDGLLDVADKAITVSVDSGTPFTVRTDNNGIARLNGNNAIEKGKTYSISGGTRENYITPPTQIYKARLNERQVTIVYRKTLTGSTTVTINVGCSDGSSMMDGKAVSLVSNNSTTYDSQVISNGVVIFTNVPLGQSYTVSFEGMTNYRTPRQQSIITSDSPITLNAIYELITQASGIYLRRSDGLEVLCSELIEFSGSTWMIKEEYQKEGETWVAFHIAFQELSESGNDYYVRPLDLTSKRTITTKQWATSQVKFPSVEMNGTSVNNLTRLDGKKETYLMFKDAGDLGILSPAANYVKTQTLVLGDKTLYGFIGTALQMNYFYSNTNGNRDIITNTLYALGYTTSTTGTPTFASTNTWSSSQSNNSFSWYWRSGGYWNNGSYYKTDSNLVLPFFAI